MKMFKKIRSIFHDDWCNKCQTEMYIDKKCLYMLPVSVDHYVSHGKDIDYYRKNLYRINKKSDIPPGFYACGIIRYKCPKLGCNYTCVKLSVFLPVRDQEKYEDIIFFENGELDFLLDNYNM